MTSFRTTPALHRRVDLLAAGWTDRRIRAAVDSGALMRLRGGVFAPADTAEGCLAAGRVGGRLTCLSELARLGVFVLEEGPLHVHVPANAPRHRRIGRPVTLHWRELSRSPHPRSLSVEPFDALVQAVRCQTPRASVATIDSALRLGVLHSDDLDALFAALPRRYRMLRKLIDPRAESGPESLLRLILMSLGCRFEDPGIGARRRPCRLRGRWLARDRVRQPGAPLHMGGTAGGQTSRPGARRTGLRRTARDRRRRHVESVCRSRGRRRTPQRPPWWPPTRVENRRSFRGLSELRMPRPASLPTLSTSPLNAGEAECRSAGRSGRSGGRGGCGARGGGKRVEDAGDRRVVVG
ncbi:hypothetical protein SAMN05880545_0690 [Microbacterium sp. RU33B]|nr:hypothetical protein SAMN05880545_0690 [Microbacterium sp. RU33B]